MTAKELERLHTESVVDLDLLPIKEIDEILREHAGPDGIMPKQYIHPKDYAKAFDAREIIDEDLLYPKVPKENFSFASIASAAKIECKSETRNLRYIGTGHVIFSLHPWKDRQLNVVKSLTLQQTSEAWELFRTTGDPTQLSVIGMCATYNAAVSWEEKDHTIELTIYRPRKNDRDQLTDGQKASLTALASYENTEFFDVNVVDGKTIINVSKAHFLKSGAYTNKDIKHPKYKVAVPMGKTIFQTGFEKIEDSKVLAGVVDHMIGNNTLYRLLTESSYKDDFTGRLDAAWEIFKSSIKRAVLHDLTNLLSSRRAAVTLARMGIRTTEETYDTIEKLSFRDEEQLNAIRAIDALHRELQVVHIGYEIEKLLDAVPELYSSFTLNLNFDKSILTNLTAFGVPYLTTQTLANIFDNLDKIARDPLVQKPPEGLILTIDINQVVNSTGTPYLRITCTDNGPGIREDVLEDFNSGKRVLSSSPYSGSHIGTTTFAEIFEYIGWGIQDPFTFINANPDGEFKNARVSFCFPLPFDSD